MTAKTITFAVQLGSGGFEVARAVAEGLKFRYYDWEITSQAASDAGVSPTSVVASEQGRGSIRGLVDRLLLNATYFSPDIGLVPTAATMTSAIEGLRYEDYRRFIERVVTEIGQQGEAVIVGHAGQVVLRDTPNVLKVLVCGSKAARSGRLAAEENIAASEANALVQQSDKDRTDFFRHVYHVELLDAPQYDLTLNTDVVTPAVAAQIVITAAEAMTGIHQEPLPDQPTTAS